MKRFMVFLCSALLIFTISGTAGASYTLHGDAVFTTDYSPGLYWMVDANYAENSDFTSDGRLNFAEANILAQQLQNSAYYGFDDWRLPSAVELGNLFHSFHSLLTQPFPFSGFRFSSLDISFFQLYWTSDEADTDDYIAYVLTVDNPEFMQPFAQPENAMHRNYAIFVSDGHQIPIPSAIFLLGSGFIGLVAFRKKFKK
jgi:hypothetical protein